MEHPSRFDQILARADDQTMSHLIGQPALRLIMALDPKMATPSHLRKIAVQLHTREGMLLSRQHRELIIDLLTPEQARSLGAVLGIGSSSDVYAELKRIKIHRHSERERALFNFFEVMLPQPEIVETPQEHQTAECSYPLFEYQRRAVSAIQRLLQKNPHRVLLHMPTGAGKTRTAMNIIADHLRQNEPTVVVWLAHSEELCEQAASEFEKAWSFLGNRPINIWRFWGSRELEPTRLQDGIVIAGLSKTYNAARSDISFIVELARHTSLVIIDEAHSAIAETYRLILDALVVQRQKTALLGLTATPGRTWADIRIDEQLAEFFNRQKVTLSMPGYANPIDYLVDQQYLAQVEYRSLFYKSGIELSNVDRERIKHQLEIPENVLKLLAEDEMRNLAIITEVEQLAKRHARILVFATTVHHADLLACILSVRGHKAASITSRTENRLRAQLIENFKSETDSVQILCNFGVLTTGFNAPRTSAALIARPTKSLVLYSQMVGRAIRGPRAGGNARAEIVTVVDHQLPGFGSVAESFINWEDVWE
jgi:DNA repair protein RadD